MTPMSPLRIALATVALIVSLPLSAQDDTAPQDAGAEPTASSQPAPAQPPAPDVQAPSLEQAYQREFAFLQGQKADLEQRLARVQERTASEQNALEAEIRALEAEVVSMGGDADRLEERVFESELAVDTARENTDLLANTFIQADFTLEDAYSPDFGGNDGERAPGAEDVSGLFDAALAELRESGAIRTIDGEFFLADGARVDGRIVQVGAIASYGVSSRGSGVLAPAGDGGLKLWNDETAETADALAAGNAPDTLPIFIYESLTTEVEKKGVKGVFDVVASGGVIGWIIFFLGLLGLLLVVLRMIFLQRASASTGRISEAVTGHVRRGDKEAALDVLKRKKGSTARVVSAAIRNLDRDRAHIEDIVSESILHESSYLNRFGAFIMVIAAVSPLLGLLGTVTGMISTFDVITEFGTGDPKLLSGGISIALVTTELGLIVAIPMLVFGNLLSGWAEKIKDSMEQSALHIINQSYEGRSRPAASGSPAS